MQILIAVLLGLSSFGFTGSDSSDKETLNSTDYTNNDNTTFRGGWNFGDNQ